MYVLHKVCWQMSDTTFKIYFKIPPKPGHDSDGEVEQRLVDGAPRQRPGGLHPCQLRKGDRPQDRQEEGQEKGQSSRKGHGHEDEGQTRGHQEEEAQGQEECSGQIRQQ